MITIILVILAGIFKGFMDKIRQWWASRWANLPETHWFYKWGKPEISWINKWEEDKYGAIIPCVKAPWYYLWVYRPDFKERFPFSSTILVSTTDAWHFFNLLQVITLMLAIVTYTPLLCNSFDFAIFITAYLSTFTIAFHYALKKK